MRLWISLILPPAVVLFAAGSALAQPNPNNEHVYSTNKAGVVILSRNPEVGTVVYDVRRLIAAGELRRSLEVCNGTLATNATDRWVRLERMKTYFLLGETAKEEEDFAELARRYPDFPVPFRVQATILAARPVSESGASPFLDWLNSGDERKRHAAEETVRGYLEVLSQEEMGWLKSSSKGQRRAAMEVLQGISAATGQQASDTQKK